MSDAKIGHRICCFGDSLVNGVRDGEKGGWPMRLGRRMLAEAKRDVTVYNLGVRAETTEGLKARWKFEAGLRMVPEFPSVLMFGFGVHDANHAEERGEETSPIMKITKRRRGGNCGLNIPPGLRGALGP